MLNTDISLSLENLNIIKSTLPETQLPSRSLVAAAGVDNSPHLITRALRCVGRDDLHLDRGRESGGRFQRH